MRSQPPETERPICLIVIAVLGINAVTAFGEDTADGPAATLNEYVSAYFLKEAPEERNKLVPEIERAADGSIETVLSALANVQVWPAIDTKEFEIDVPDEFSGSWKWRVRVPNYYDANRRHPLLLALRDDTAQSKISTKSLTEDAGEKMIIASPLTALPTRYLDAARARDIARRTIAVLRHKLHIDSNRIYIYGHGIGADAALCLLLDEPNMFAGSILREAVFHAPYARELLPLLLSNLHETPTRFIWTEPPLPTKALPVGREHLVALMSLIVRNAARQHSLPITETILIPETSGESIDLQALLQESRKPTRLIACRTRWVIPVRHGFVHSTSRPDQPVSGLTEQIDIRTAPHTDPSIYATTVLDSLLTHVECRIEGQAIDVHIKTGRHDGRGEHARLTLNLSADMLNYDEPVTIRRDGFRVFEGRLTPRISTTLESAYEEWEFQSPAVVRIDIYRGRATQRN